MILNNKQCSSLLPDWSARTARMGTDKDDNQFAKPCRYIFNAALFQVVFSYLIVEHFHKQRPCYFFTIRTKIVPENNGGGGML